MICWIPNINRVLQMARQTYLILSLIWNTYFPSEACHLLLLFWHNSLVQGITTFIWFFSPSNNCLYNHESEDQLKDKIIFITNSNDYINNRFNVIAFHTGAHCYIRNISVSNSRWIIKYWGNDKINCLTPFLCRLNSYDTTGY